MLQVFFRSCLCWWRRSTWLSARTCLCSPSERTRPPEIAGLCPARFGSTPPAHHFGDHHLMNGDNDYLIILSSTFLGNTNDDLSIRREHCLKVALFHRVGQVGNVEVRRILFRLASHLCLTMIQGVKKVANRIFRVIFRGKNFWQFGNFDQLRSLWAPTFGLLPHCSCLAICGQIGPFGPFRLWAILDLFGHFGGLEAILGLFHISNVIDFLSKIHHNYCKICPSQWTARQV